MKQKDVDRDLPPQLFDSRTSTFWQHAFALKGSITPHVMPNVCIMGVVASAVCGVSWVLSNTYGIYLALPVAPYEFIGAALGLLLVLRTNTGYERWWEARKLWGGIVNQSRNMAISGVAYGPKSANWRDQFLRWVAAFPYAACASLRGESQCSQLVSLLGEHAAEELDRADHKPSFVAQKLAVLLRQAYDEGALDPFALMQIDRERALLIDHIGACERIMKTPLALAYSIKIRRFITIFLVTLPFALIHSVGHNWLVPVLTMLVAYPLFSLDQLGFELQNPFSIHNLSHLPLDDISQNIERNVMSLRQTSQVTLKSAAGLIPESLDGAKLVL